MIDLPKTYDQEYQPDIDEINEQMSLGNIFVVSEGDLRLYSYTRHAMYSSSWNIHTINCRGLILDTSGRVVCRPLHKFFGWNQYGRRAHYSTHLVSVTEKLDGTMISVYFYNDEWKTSTTGGISTEQALWAKDFLSRHQPWRDFVSNASVFMQEYTLVFEAIYPENRVVVGYGDRRDMVLLAIRHNASGVYQANWEVEMVAQQYGFSRPVYYTFNSIDEILAASGVIDANQEGWILEFSDQDRFKIKGDRYTELHKLIDGVTRNKIVAAIATGTLDEVLGMIPDEFIVDPLQWVEEITREADEFVDMLMGIYEQAPKASRKIFGEWVMQNHKKLNSYLFNIWDGGDLMSEIYHHEFGWKRAGNKHE